MIKYIPILITFFVLTGCSNSPNETTSKLTLGLAQSTVAKGANQTEIVKVLGAPNIISRDKQGNETWTYDRISRDTQSNSRSAAGFGALFGWIFAGGSSSASSSISNKSLTVIITFDDNKNVIDYAYQSLEF
jgi:outer membrane protein assembly factor BamE (lipoprotein component of BamABCDE complex)